MFRGLAGLILAGILFPFVASAERPREEQGFELGSVRIRPVAEAQAAYDNRVVDKGNGDINGDLYSELAAYLYLENNPAQYDFSANAGYGNRYYREFTDLNNDFYEAGFTAASVESPLKLGLSSYVKKTLNYDTVYTDASGAEPGAILTRDPSTRYAATANVAYERNLTDKTSLTPGYEYWYYFQDFVKADDAQWQTHRVSLQGGYRYSEKTRIFLTGYYSLQINDKEDGTIGAVTLGAEGRFSDKTTWLAHLGVAAVDYEESGADQGVVGMLRSNWSISEKLSAYVYGSSNFQPGYNNGSARRVYRLSYGALWRMVERWRLSAQILHDYQEELGGSGGSDTGAKHFGSLSTEYDLTSRLALGAGFRYIMDEEDTDQTIADVSAVYRY